MMRGSSSVFVHVTTAPTLIAKNMAMAKSQTLGQAGLFLLRLKIV
jgi:hypothetical protein